MDDCFDDQPQLFFKKKKKLLFQFLKSLMKIIFKIILMLNNSLLTYLLSI